MAETQRCALKCFARQLVGLQLPADAMLWVQGLAVRVPDADAGGDLLLDDGTGLVACRFGGTDGSDDLATLSPAVRLGSYVLVRGPPLCDLEGRSAVVSAWQHVVFSSPEACVREPLWTAEGSCFLPACSGTLFEASLELTFLFLPPPPVLPGHR